MTEAASGTSQITEDRQPGERESFSVVIPAYNEEAGILDALTALQAALASESCEIIVVDDGSTDRTAELLRSVAGIRTIAHTNNRGYGAALKTGIRHARHPLIVIVVPEALRGVARAPQDPGHQQWPARIPQ